MREKKRDSSGYRKISPSEVSKKLTGSKKNFLKLLSKATKMEPFDKN